MEIFDCHVHLFTARIIENVIPRTDLVKKLDLNVKNIDMRSSSAALAEAMRSACVCGALMLPTADVAKISTVNRNCIETAAEITGLHTAGTLHPEYPDIDGELSYLSDAGVRIIKLCSFSQRFSLSDPGTNRMFERIQSFNGNVRAPFSVILDTLTLADQYFGTNPMHTTTPPRLMGLVRRFPGIRFIGAHMGGLGAPFDQLDRDLEPESNLYLDTSNAAHTLTEDQFVRMLRRFGSEHVLFGTDWPWFLHDVEIDLINDRLETARFTADEKQAVFSGNIEKIIGAAASP